VPSCEPTAAQQNAACLALPLPHNGCLTAFATGTGCGNAEPVLCDYYEPTTPPMPACVPDPNKWCRIPFSNKACPGSMM
jgi:hypothetical protein